MNHLTGDLLMKKQSQGHGMLAAAISAAVLVGACAMPPAGPDAAQGGAGSETFAADHARTTAAFASMRGQIASQQGGLPGQAASAPGLATTFGAQQFASGSAVLVAGPGEELETVLAYLTRHGESRLLVEGHTDSDGAAQANLRLSQQRAAAVKAWLVERGIGASRIDATGMGEGYPIADNGAATGREQNRRVQLQLQEVILSSR
jgi:outer membrane protein OmpA-like peptidoglycan-associated protein